MLVERLDDTNALVERNYEFRLHNWIRVCSRLRKAVVANVDQIPWRFVTSFVTNSLVVRDDARNVAHPPAPSHHSRRRAIETVLTENSRTQ